MKALAAKLLLMVAAPTLMLGIAELGYRGWLKIQSPEQDPGFDLYVIGGSSSRGEPFPPRLNPGALASFMLGEELSGQPIRVHLLARSGASIYPQALALQRALRLRRDDNPAAVFIYSGHNEGLSRQPAQDALWRKLKRLLMRSSQLLADLLIDFERRNLLRGHRDLAHYERWLRHAIEVSLAAGAQPVISTVASNVAGIEPGLPPHAPAPEIRERMRRVRERVEAGDTEGAHAELQAAATAIPVARALFEFEGAQLLRAAGESARAWEEFLRIVDTHPGHSFGRSTRPQNARVEALAQDYGIPLLDTFDELARRSPDGIIDARFFADGHHPNLEGYTIIAGKLAHVLAERCGGTVKHPDPNRQTLFEFFELDANAQARLRAHAASWLISVSLRYPWPERRFEMARAHIAAAHAAHPHHLGAWLMDALVQAVAHKPKLLYDRGHIAWLRKQGFFYASWNPCRVRDRIDQLAHVFEGWRVRRSTLAGLRRAAQSLDPKSCGRER